MKAKIKPRTGSLDAATQAHILKTYQIAASNKPKKPTTSSVKTPTTKPVATNTLRSLASSLSTAPTLNSVSPAVKTLQRFLNEAGYIVSSSGLGSKGFESDTFGNATRNALLRFQKANALPESGVFDLKTRTLVKTKFGG